MDTSAIETTAALIENVLTGECNFISVCKVVVIVYFQDLTEEGVAMILIENVLTL